MPRVFVASRLPAVRAGLRALLGADGGCEIVGDGDRYDPSALEGEPVPDVVVLDLRSTLELDGAGAEQIGGPALLVLGPLDGDEQLPSLLAGRAWAYVAREATGEQLLAAVRGVANGLTVIDPLIGGHLVAGREAAAAGRAEPLDEQLTAREREVLDLVARGLANKTIAARLGISEHTVKFHVAAILGKLGAGSRTEAVHLGARRGLIAL